MNDNKTKIYLAVQPTGWTSGDVVGYALAEDGKGLCSHLSSSITWSQHDLGLTSDWKHDIYKKNYPNGYELEWVNDPHTHKGWLKAMGLNKVLSKAEGKL